MTGDKKKSGLIRKYGLNMSRQAFREKAEEIGFRKVRDDTMILLRRQKLIQILAALKRHMRDSDVDSRRAV